MELFLLMFLIALSETALACWRFPVDRGGFRSNYVIFPRPQIQLGFGNKVFLYIWSSGAYFFDFLIGTFLLKGLFHRVTGLQRKEFSTGIRILLAYK